MAAPLGNQNAAKAKLWTAAIERALEKRGVSKVEALDSLAEKLLMKADDGDMQALKELGDRLEGKPKQQIDLGNADGEAFKTVTRIELVAPSDDSTA